ncbi:MAG TPA: hypothetical protein PKL65_04195 [Bacteroidales bacterium]|nr:hypothetical protein [Bacteroidales bacterium]HNR41411.1 hypothetical protein [Bacteroidales bacterium]HPM18526.1 hypothetical protein [Bacteroidales bacterium]HQG76197.1 hypothetical protein [Bacteroidales bacterium]
MMIRIICYAVLILILNPGCRSNSPASRRIPLAKAGNTILYYDEIPEQVTGLITAGDSNIVIQNYINSWAKRVLMYQKAEANLSSELKNEIEKQLDETRVNLIVHEYQQKMMQAKMDTIITDNDLESYYAENENSFYLTSNIVKALFIKLPVETPGINRIKQLYRSDNQKDMQDLEALCFQFAEKFDDFNEKWITMDRLMLELNEKITGQEAFLSRNNHIEVTDSFSVYLIRIYDFRLRGSLAPFEYVRDDIKRIIWNNRRIGFIKNLETEIYNDAIKENIFKTYR